MMDDLGGGGDDDDEETEAPGRWRPSTGAASAWDGRGYDDDDDTAPLALPLPARAGQDTIALLLATGATAGTGRRVGPFTSPPAAETGAAKENEPQGGAASAFDLSRFSFGGQGASPPTGPPAVLRPSAVGSNGATNTRGHGGGKKGSGGGGVSKAKRAPATVVAATVGVREVVIDSDADSEGGGGGSGVGVGRPAPVKSGGLAQFAYVG
jgi:hypothetical protein